MSKKMTKTNAARILDKEKIPYEIIQYEMDDGLVDGISVAAKIGHSEELVYKTLVAVGSSKQHYVFVIPVAEELNLKAAAKAAGEKRIEMAPVKDIFQLTGYVRGGCSPVGMKKPFPTFLAQQAEMQPQIIVSAGKIGMQIKVDPAHLQTVTGARFAALTVGEP
ncbi:Cys-tRNA(Pro) deacylase [Planococcus sp. CAU13]|uniref:Cys-tRNA(Pro) deacylase n=1 Tax=Planococcus sp. CAU13 TaxID=1541197 RepID=UPI00052FE6C9|nr:Cys-tRNA(Pro) deacylase [Planococcus sp. CAU13]